MGDQELAKIDVAKRALMEARSIPEIKDIRDKAEAIRLYYRKRGSNLEVQNLAAELKLRAERKLGELLREMEKAKGAAEEGWKTRSHDVTALPPTYSELGIGKMSK